MPKNRGGAFAAGLAASLAAWHGRGALAYLLGSPSTASPSLSWILRRDAAAWLAAAALALSAFALGRTILRRAVGREADEGPGPLAAFALGLGLLSLALFALGLAGLFASPWLPLAGLAPLALSRRPPPFRRPRLGSSLAAGAMAGLAAFAFWHGAVRATAPPTDWDALSYHLAVPRLYLLAGGIVELPWLFQSHFPNTLELLDAVPLSLGLDNGPALLQLIVCAALALATFAVGREALGEAPAFAAACLLACQPVFLYETGASLDDALLALFHLLSAWSLLRGWKQRSRGWLAAAGGLAGFGAGVKYHGLVLLAALAAWAAWRTIRERRSPLGLALFAASAAAASCPWYLRNWAEAGNPVWPFLSGFFGGRWGPGLIWSARPGGFLASSLPWQLWKDGAAFLLLPLGALALAARPRLRDAPPVLGILAWPMLLYAFLALRAISGWRYCLPLFPGLALAAAWLAARAAEAGRRASAGAALAFGLLPAAAAVQNNELFAALGLRSASRPGLAPDEAYLERALDGWSLLRGGLPKGSRTLFFHESRGFYFEGEYVWGDPGQQGLLDYGSLRDGPELLERLRGLGVTHVLLRRGGWYGAALDRTEPRAAVLMHEALETGARELARDGDLFLYELEPGHPRT